MATQKRFLIVVDGDSVMGPFWPMVVSEYIQKIVRHLCGNSRSGQGANTTVCEVGLVMYNANSESGCSKQFIQWTSDVDEFLNKLPYLAFKGDGFNASAMTEGLAEALLMFPKPSTGTPTRVYNGERHCILVAANDPFTGRVTMVLPKIREGEFACKDVEICRVDYKHVARMFTPLGISLSVISPKKLPIWRVIFNLGNNILEIACTNPVADSSGWFTVFLPESLKEACVEPEETTTDVTFPAYSFFSNDSEDLFQIARQMTVPQQINGTELESLTSLKSQPVVTQNQNATDPTQIASSSSTLPPMNAYEYDDFSDMISELNADSDFVFPWNKPSSCTTLEEDNLSELFNPTPFMSPFDGMGNSLDPQQSNSNGKQVSTDSFWDQNELEQALLPFYKPKGQSSTSASTSNAVEQALLGSNSTPPNLSGSAQTFIPTSTDNSSKEVANSSLLVEPQLAPSNNIWSSMGQNLGGNNNSFMNAQNPINNSWASAASALLPSSLLHTGHQAHLVGAQSTSDIMNSNGILQGTNNAGHAQIVPTRGVFSLADIMNYTSGGIMNTNAIGQGFSGAQNNTSIPVGAAFGNSIFPHAMTNSYLQPSSSSPRNQIAPYDIISPSTSISEILEQNFSGHKRDLTSAFGSTLPAPRANPFFVSTVLPSRFHPPLVLPLVPMELQPDYVPTWQGAISGILQSATICYNEVRAYRKASARETLTVQWPRWLQINRTVRQSIVNNSLRVYRGPVDYVVLEILTCNNNHLHDCLRNRDFIPIQCAKLVLPSQTLLLTPTIEPHRFIGTVLQGRHDFTALQFTHASRSRAARALRFM